MPEFPNDEISTVILGQSVANGIKNNSATFPNPAVEGTEMLTDIDAYNAKNVTIQAKKAALKLEIQEKNVIYKRIRSATRRNIDYAEIVAQGDNAILELVSWGTRADPQRMQPPGQCRVLEIIGQGSGWVRLDWKEPIDGGEVASYKLQRGEDGENFSDVGAVTDSIAALFDQPTGKKLFYRVVAINKEGEGVPGNVVVLTL